MRKRMQACMAGAMMLAVCHVAAAQVSVGQEFPDFEGVDANGQKVTMKDLRGQVVLVKFWATW